MSLAALIIAVLAFGLAVFSLLRTPPEMPSQPSQPPAPGMSQSQPAPPSESKDFQYVLYVGTNDKDTNTQKFDNDECKAKVDEVLAKHLSGYTISDATGGWVSDDGKVYHEYTIVISISDTTEDKVHDVSDELIGLLNQSSILIQKNETKTEFYSGK